MKKWFVLCLAALLLLMAACGAKEATPEVQQEPAIQEAPVLQEEPEVLTLDLVTLDHLTETELPEDPYQLSDEKKVSLVAADNERGIYLYCLNNKNSWGGQGVILRSGEEFWTYDLYCLTKYSHPVMKCMDWDSDGMEEVVCYMDRQGGTGLYIQDLYVFEYNGSSYDCVPFETALIRELINGQLTITAEGENDLQVTLADGETISIPAGRGEAMLMDHISFELKDGEMYLTTDVYAVEEAGSWSYICDYLDTGIVDMDACAGDGIFHELTAKVTYDGVSFDLYDLALLEKDPLADIPE